MFISISHTEETLLDKRCTNHAKYSKLYSYNIRIGRIQEHSIVTTPTVVYLPLVDMHISEPTTMITAIVEAQELTNAISHLHQRSAVY